MSGGKESCLSVWGIVSEICNSSHEYQKLHNFLAGLVFIQNIYEL